MTNEQIVALVKGLITTGDGGQLNQQQRDSFIETTVDSSEVLKVIGVERDIAVERKLDILGMASGIIRPGVEGDDNGVKAEPTFTNKLLTPKGWKVVAGITYDKLAQVLGGSGGQLNPDVITKFEQQLTSALGLAAGNDISDILWNGDTASGATYLTVCDGIIKKAAADGDVQSINFNDEDMSVQFAAMYAKLPFSWQQRKNMMTYCVSTTEELRYRTELSQRPTGGGDDWLTTNKPLFWNGIPVKSWYMFPESKMLLTPMKNLAIGFGSDMLKERDKDIIKQVVNIVLSGRFDVNYILPEAMVIAK